MTCGIPSRASDAGPDIQGETCPQCYATLRKGHSPQWCYELLCTEMVCKNCERYCGCHHAFCEKHAKRVDGEWMCGKCDAIFSALRADPHAFDQGGLD